MPTRAMSGSQGGAQPGSPGVRAPGLLSGPGPPPTGGTTPHRAATGQFGYSRLLPAGMCGLALLVGDMTGACPRPNPGHTKQAHGGSQGPGAAIRPPSPRSTADAERPGPRRANARAPRSSSRGRAPRAMAPTGPASPAGLPAASPRPQRSGRTEGLPGSPVGGNRPLGGPHPPKTNRRPRARRAVPADVRFGSVPERETGDIRRSCGGTAGALPPGHHTVPGRALRVDSGPGLSGLNVTLKTRCAAVRSLSSPNDGSCAHVTGTRAT